MSSAKVHISPLCEALEDSKEGGPQSESTDNDGGVELVVSNVVRVVVSCGEGGGRGGTPDYKLQQL
jgi:hypothetical protein